MRTQIFKGTITAAAFSASFLSICTPALAGTPLATRAGNSVAMHHPAIATQSMVFVERLKPDTSRHLEPADQLSRGDRVITILNWKRANRTSSPFVIVNPLPSPIAYEASASDDQEVSVDGGRTWGELNALRIGKREATPEDVTHMRWRIVAPDDTSGQITYSAIVR